MVSNHQTAVVVYVYDQIRFEFSCQRQNNAQELSKSNIDNIGESMIIIMTS